MNHSYTFARARSGLIARTSRIFVFLAAAFLGGAWQPDACAEPVATYSFDRGWATFGLALPRGAAAGGLQIGTLPTQTDIKTTWPDGSIRFAVVTADIPAAADYAIAGGPQSSGAFTPQWPVAAVQFVIGGDTWTAALPPGPSSDLWLNGPLVLESRAVVAPSAGETSHPFLRVIFDVRTYATGGHRVDVTVENVLDQLGAATTTYDVRIVVNGVERFSKLAVEHYYLTRWRKKYDNDLITSSVTPDLAPFHAAAAIPPYLSLVSNQVNDSTGPAFEILNSGALLNNMPAHGGRAELAPYPDWTARYLVHKNPTQLQFVLAQGDLSGSWPIHVREPEGGAFTGVGPERLISLDERPTIWLDSRAQETGFGYIKGTPLPIREYGTLEPGPGQSPLIPDNAHQPSLAFIPYLLTGDRYYAEEAAFWANYSLLRTFPGDGTRGSSGVIANNEVRGYGWALRNMVDIAAYYPDASPVRNYLSQKVANNLQWLDDYANAQDPAANPLLALWLGRRDDCNKTCVSVWEQSYLAFALDRASKHGFEGGVTHRDMIAKFQLRLFTSDPDYPRSWGAPYLVKVGVPLDGAPTHDPAGNWIPLEKRFTFYRSMAEIFAATNIPDLSRPFPGFYGPEARLMLMIGIENGWTGAREAYDYLWPFIGVDPYTNSNPDLGNRAGWAIAAATRPTQPIELAAAAASGVYGETMTLSATLTSEGSPLSGKSIVFTLNGVPLGSTTTNAAGVATLDGVRLAALSAGSYPAAIGASFAGEADLPPATDTADLLVLQAVPVVTWPSPADIVSGTPLGPEQLNATASVAGTFVYTPPAGTVLGPGANQVVSATFTPTDPSYQLTSATVSLNVIGTPVTIGTAIAGIFDDATGHSAQSHLVYAPNASVWWLFTLSSDHDSFSDRTVQSYVSSGPNLTTATWSAAAASPHLPLANRATDSLFAGGRSLGVALRTIGTADYVHVFASAAFDGQRSSNGHIRAQLGATSITWGEWDNPGSPNTASSWEGPAGTGDSGAATQSSWGNAVGISTGGFVHHFSVTMDQEVDCNIGRSTHADTSASWINGFGTNADPTGFSGTSPPWTTAVIDKTMAFQCKVLAFAPLAADVMLAVYSNGAVPQPNLTNLRYTRSGPAGTWTNVPTEGGGDGDVFSTAAAIDQNDWALVALNPTTVHAFRRNAAGTGLDGATYDVATNQWSELSIAPPSFTAGQTFKAGAGLFGATDGTNVWLFVINSDAANSILYTRFDGASWSPWTAAPGTETGTQTRNFIAGDPRVRGNQVGLVWTEGTTSFDIVTTSLATIQPPKQPTVTVTAPVNGSTVRGSVAVSATAAAATGSIAGVQFTLDGLDLGAEDTSSPYSVSWNTSTTSNGPHVLTAIVRDTNGATAASNAVTVTVSNAGAAPVVVITDPANGSTVSGSVRISADASDDVGVSGVQFLLDGAPLGAEMISPPYAIAWDTTGAAKGVHILAARARDTEGNQTTSTLVSVRLPKVAPTITWPAPADIVAGTPLGEEQLNATADVPGTFLYEPASGTVLAAGPAQRLTVRFTPSDTATFATATGSVPITVVGTSSAMVPAPIGNLIAGTFEDATGHSGQSHLVYAPNARVWWFFTLSSDHDSVGDRTVQSYVSNGPSLATASWTAAAASPTLANAGSATNSLLAGGRSLGVAVRSNAGVDYVHLFASAAFDGQTSSNAHIRARLNATSITWGTWNNPGSPNIAAQWRGPSGTGASGSAANTPWGNAVGISTGGYIHHFSSTMERSLDCAVGRSTNADTGWTWINGFGTNEVRDSPNRTTAVIDKTMTSPCKALAFAPLASNLMLAVYSNGMAAQPNLTNLRFLRSGSQGAWTNVTSGGGHGNVFSSNALIDQNDWALVPRSTASIFAFRRNAPGTGIDAASYVTTSNSWTAMSPAPPLFGEGQGFKAGAGVFGATDGVTVWLFVINTDAANSILYTAFNGRSWTDWAAVPGTETGTQSRNFIAGSARVGSNQVGLVWTEGTTAFDVVVTALNVGASPTVRVDGPASGSTVTATVEVEATAAPGSVAIAGVQFMLDGVNLGDEDTSSPYSVTWDTTTTSSGTHFLTATVRDVNGGTAISSTVPVTVANLVSSTIAWPTPAAIGFGTGLGAAELNATANVEGTFVYTPAPGTILAAGTHTLSVTFTPDDAVNYTTATADVTITVVKATPRITWPRPAEIVYRTPLGIGQLNATASVPGTFVYTPNAGTVLPAGTSQPLAVTFTPTDAHNYTTATAIVPLDVLKAIPAITWADPADTVYGAALGAAQLNATADIPGTFIYSPSAGTVPPAGIETLTATFTPDDAANFAATTASVSLRVLKAKGTITWAAPADMVYGSALGATQLNAATDIAGAFVYTPAAGAVLAAGSHTLSVTFTPSDGANYEPATARVALTVVKATPLITWATPADVVYGTALSVTQLNATSAVEGTFTYTPALGAVLPAGPQTLSVTFTPNDGANYNTATATVPLTVLKAAPAITWAVPTDIAYGTALSAAQLNATSALEGTFAYTPANGAVLPAGPQTLSVTFTPADAGNYNTATATVALTVVKATPAITWAAPTDIAYGTALSAAQLNATSAVEGTFAYTPASGAVLPAGPQTLSVTFTPTDGANYNTATGTVPLTVLKATPAITWAAPTDITYGTALSAAQLNATSSVEGTFAYTPALDAVLSAGPQTLLVTFTPNDGANYNTATATVPLTVLKAAPAITWAAPTDITYGTALSAAQLNATSAIEGTFAYTPAIGAVLPAGPQTLSVTFTPTDAANYTAATATVSLIVVEATSTTAWLAPADIVYGRALSTAQLNATSAVEGTFTYTPAIGTVLSAGPQPLPVTFTPTDATNYNAATATVSLTLLKALPWITQVMVELVYPSNGPGNSCRDPV